MWTFAPTPPGNPRVMKTTSSIPGWTYEKPRAVTSVGSASSQSHRIETSCGAKFHSALTS